MHRFLPGIAFVFESVAFRLVVVPTNVVIDAQVPGRIRVGTALGVNAVEDVTHGVLRDHDLPAQNAGVTCLRVVAIALRWRELIAAIGAAGIASGDLGVAFGTLLRRGLAVAAGGTLSDLDLIDWAVPQYVAAEVEHETVLLAGVQAEAPADHSSIEGGSGFMQESVFFEHNYPDLATPELSEV